MQSGLYKKIQFPDVLSFAVYGESVVGAVKNRFRWGTGKIPPEKKYRTYTGAQQQCGRGEAGAWRLDSGLCGV